MRFNTRSDLFCKFLTNLFIILCLLLLAVNTLFAYVPGLYAPLVVLSLIVLVAWGLHPQYYVIGEDELEIKRPFSSIRISLLSITSAQQLEEGELGVMARMFASGGLFGYFGTYSSSTIGAFDMWSTNKEELVLIIADDKKLVISPQDREKLIAELWLARNQLR